MKSFWDLFPVSALPVQPFTWPPDPSRPSGGQQGTAARRDASMSTSPALGWAPGSGDPAGSPTYFGGHDRSTILGESPDADVYDPASTARLVEDAQSAYELAMWAFGPASRGPARRTRELAANLGPSTNTPAIPTAATTVAPPAQRAGAQAWPGTQAQSKYWQATHGVDTGLAPQNLPDGAVPERMMDGWSYGYGDAPIIPHRFVGPDTKINGVPDWLQPDARALWNIGTLPTSWIDTGLRASRGATYGGTGLVADLGERAGLGNKAQMDNLNRDLNILLQYPGIEAIAHAPVVSPTVTMRNPRPVLRPAAEAFERGYEVGPQGAGAPGGEFKQFAGVAAPGSRDAAFYNAPYPNAPFPQYATEYPPVGPPVLRDKKTGRVIEGVSGSYLEPQSDAQRMVDAGTAYWAKNSTPEADAFAKARTAIMRDMEQNGYTPYFDPAQRASVDPANYPTSVDTVRDALPKKQQTLDKHTTMIDTPGARARLQAGYDAGKTVPDSDRWYAMKQLEDKYIEELGPAAGRAAFKRKFAEAMAATTSGADPRSNYLMSQYGNHLVAHDMPTPPTHQLPYPIGGRYAASNLNMFDKTVRDPAWMGFDQANPKRHDFSYALMGHPNKMAMDEQMTGAILPGQSVPPGKSYGVAAGLGHELARLNGVNPVDFQDVTWAGLKELKKEGCPQCKYAGPMINHPNDSIERTHRLTGMPRDEIVRRGIVENEIPIYGLGGAAIGLPWLFPPSDPAQE